MSQDGQSQRADTSEQTVFVATFEMDGGTSFEWHVHEDHQLAWASEGVLCVRSDATRWVLPPTRALWIPAGVRHETLSSGPATMRSLYIETNECPIDWVAPTAVAMTELFRELVDHLGLESLGASERSHAEALLVDLLQPVSVMTIDVEMPTEARAREVAQRVAHSPEDRRTLGEWGHEVGASDRTLARVFVKETGLGFGRWRTLVRIQAALGMLAAGESVTNVAYRVGYDTTSAFVAAFRRETGTTPAAYFRTSGTR